MTIALCVKCGAEKFGSFTRCTKCGFFPETEDDFVYSLALSDHYFSPSTLTEIGAHIGMSGRVPRLPPEQEERFRKAIRQDEAVLALLAKQRPIIECPECAQRLRLPSGKQGTVTCPRCKARFTTDTASRTVRRETSQAGPGDASFDDEGTVHSEPSGSSIDVESLAQQFRGRKFGELVLDHCKKLNFEVIIAALQSTIEELPQDVRPSVESWIDEIGPYGVEPSFWRRDCGEVFREICGSARRRLASHAIRATDDQLLSMFQIIVLNFAYGAHKHPQSKAFIQQSIGIGFLRRVFS